jgi:hypothetical protein
MGFYAGILIVIEKQPSGTPPLLSQILAMVRQAHGDRFL